MCSAHLVRTTRLSRFLSQLSCAGVLSLAAQLRATQTAMPCILYTCCYSTYIPSFPHSLLIGTGLTEEQNRQHKVIHVSLSASHIRLTRPKDGVFFIPDLFTNIYSLIYIALKSTTTNFRKTNFNLCPKSCLE